MTNRPGPTLATADHISGGLHVQPQLAIDVELGTNHEPGHAHQHGGTPTTVNHRQGSLLHQTCIPHNDGALANVS